MNFKEKFKNKQDIVNKYLEEIINIKDAPGIIVEAMKYSLLAGGKRIRPILAISVCEALGGDYKEVLPFGCAIELIHTYSLIHDDLPAMDNDSLRRGKPTNHVIFGDAKAILAGDGLLNYSFEIMLSEIEKRDFEKRYVKAASVIAKASGVKGMIGGQVVDIESENKKIDFDTLLKMHKGKTGALIEAPCIVGAIIAGKEDKIDIIRQYSRNLGIAFQIVDDILDYEGDCEILGKSTGKDSIEGKSTFVSINGIDESKRMAEDYSEKAMEIALKIDSIGFLKDLTNYLLVRKS